MKPPRPYARTGLNALKARVKLRGLGTVDRRTAAARDLIAFREELERDLGGRDNLSAQQLALVNLATRARLLLDHVDAWIFEQKSLVNSRARALLPVVKERQGLAEHLARVLGQLGLERRARPVATLAEIIAARSDAKAASPV